MTTICKQNLSSACNISYYFQLIFSNVMKLSLLKKNHSELEKVNLKLASTDCNSCKKNISQGKGGS